MILVIGGLEQGQAEYASGRWPEREQVADIQELTRAMNAEEAAERLLSEHPRSVLLACEIGSGVMPLEADDRRWRVETGRMLQELARSAEEVHRVCCGLGVRLK